jgi:hypothetical protein
MWFGEVGGYNFIDPLARVCIDQLAEMRVTSS